MLASSSNQPERGTMNHHRVIRTAALGLALAALAAPAAGAKPTDVSIATRHAAQVAQTTKSVDLRSPDARDAALAAAAPKAVDLRSPDARDAALAAAAPKAVDLRSPDARDAARGVSTRGTSPAASPKSTGTDWGDVGIVAGSSVFGLMLLGLGIAVISKRRAAVKASRAAVLSH
jgi:hypothetical protein